MSENTIVFPQHATSSPGFDRFGTLVNADELKRLYLWGVKLTNQQGVEIPEEVINHHILEAVSFIEHTLNVTITPTEYSEKQDFRNNEYNSWCLLNLQHSPIIEVEHVACQFINDQSLIIFPKEWIRTYNLSGQVQLTPTSGTLGAFAISMSGFMILPGGFLARSDFPQLFDIKYTAGFEQDKIPLIINGLVAKWASLNILAILGNLVLAPGIQGYAIGLDGASQSVNKIPNPYMFLAQQYMSSFNAQLTVAKNFYQRINIQVS